MNNSTRVYLPPIQDMLYNAPSNSISSMKNHGNLSQKKQTFYKFAAANHTF